MNQTEPSKPVQTRHGATPTPFNGRVTVTPTKPGKIIRLPLVEDRTGIKKSSIYALEKEGCFPSRVRLTARSVGWHEEQIDRWVAERVTIGAQS